MRHSPWSARSTQRVFRRYVGVPVKWVLCRYRLQQAALEIESQPGVDFADLAVRLGWYDQAHFINDFRSMLGCTPGEYAASTARAGPCSQVISLDQIDTPPRRARRLGRCVSAGFADHRPSSALRPTRAD